MNRKILYAVSALLLAATCGCSTDSNSVPEAEPPADVGTAETDAGSSGDSTSEEESATEAPTEEETADSAEWKAAYLQVIDDIVSEWGSEDELEQFDSLQGALLYLDDDNIPEMYFAENMALFSGGIYTYYDGEAVLFHPIGNRESYEGHREKSGAYKMFSWYYDKYYTDFYQLFHGMKDHTANYTFNDMGRLYLVNDAMRTENDYNSSIQAAEAGFIKADIVTTVAEMREWIVKEKPPTDTTPAATEPPTEAPSGDMNWKEAYSQLAEEIHAGYGDSIQMALLYVDGDMTPEFVVSDADNPEVSGLYAWKNGQAVRIIDFDKHETFYCFTPYAGYLTTRAEFVDGDYDIEKDRYYEISGDDYTITHEFDEINGSFFLDGEMQSHGEAFLVYFTYWGEHEPVYSTYPAILDDIQNERVETYQHLQ